MYLYHRFLLSYRDVQELLFERGINVSHETVRAWCVRFGPDLAEALRHRRLRVLVKRILRKHGFPPDQQDGAVQTVLKQAEALSATWAS